MSRVMSSTTVGRSPRELWRQNRPVHCLALHQQLTIGIARLALIAVTVEHEIFLFYQAAELLVSYRGRQHIEGRIREPGSQPTPCTESPTHLGYSRRPYPRRRSLAFRLCIYSL